MRENEKETVQCNEIGFAFDLDGTLIDTEKYKAISHQQTISFYGGNSPLSLYYDYIGNSFEFVFQQLVQITSLNVSLKDYQKTFNNYYLKQLDDKLTANPGVIEILSTLSFKGIKMALVTSSERWMMDQIIEKIQIKHFFDVLICGDDVKENKPSPAPYLLAIELLKSKKTFAFEDTIPGISSALNAGAIVFGVKNDYNTIDDLRLTKEIFFSFNELDIDSILQNY